jgi:hypothetical protein
MFYFTELIQAIFWMLVINIIFFLAENAPLEPRAQS